MSVHLINWLSITDLAIDIINHIRWILTSELISLTILESYKKAIAGFPIISEILSY